MNDSITAYVAPSENPYIGIEQNNYCYKNANVGIFWQSCYDATINLLFQYFLLF